MDAAARCIAEDGGSPPGRRGLSEGLCPTRDDGESFFCPAPARVDAEEDEGPAFGGLFLFAPTLDPAPSTDPSSGASPLDRPNRPSPIIAAGVTGAIAAGLVGLVSPCCPLAPSPGGAGGGIDKSTGDGLSSATAWSNGVEFVEREPRG